MGVRGFDLLKRAVSRGIPAVMLTADRLNPIQKYLKFPGYVILNHVLMKIRVVSGSHQIGPMGEMLNRVQHDSLF